MKIAKELLEIKLVLIETYWNVNTRTWNKYDGLLYGINRNILECK